MFQWAFLCELTLVTIFWFYLWVMETDTSTMTHQEVVNKIIYDVFIDVGNYEHTVPVFLLLIEFCINNIIFCWTHFYICILINWVYLVFTLIYCMVPPKHTIYEGIDFNKNFGDALLKSFSSTVVMTCWFFIILIITKSKFWLNGLQGKIDKANKTYRTNMEAYYAQNPPVRSSVNSRPTRPTT